jgi:colicin import membrane protein
MKTELAISFLPSGEVLAVNIIKGSGDALFDQRAEDAARSIVVKELSEVDPYVFDRNFRRVVIIFNPQDLRN